MKPVVDEDRNCTKIVDKAQYTSNIHNITYE